MHRCMAGGAAGTAPDAACGGTGVCRSHVKPLGRRGLQAAAFQGDVSPTRHPRVVRVSRRLSRLLRLRILGASPLPGSAVKLSWLLWLPVSCACILWSAACSNSHYHLDSTTDSAAEAGLDAIIEPEIDTPIDSGLAEIEGTDTYLDEGSGASDDSPAFDADVLLVCPDEQPEGACSGRIQCSYGHGPACYSVDYGDYLCACLEEVWHCSKVLYDCPSPDVLNRDDGGRLDASVEDSADDADSSSEDALGDVSAESGAACDRDGDCDDGNFCTEDVCAEGGICGHSPRQCLPSDDCHGSACDPVKGECVEDLLPDGTPCEDDERCLIGDTCQGGVCVSGAIIIDCCTPGSEASDDGNKCNGDDWVCGEDGIGYDMTTPPVVCPVLLDPCLLNRCDPVDGVCKSEALPENTPCGDGLTCVSGQCR